jgi:bacteriocin-like protein
MDHNHIATTPTDKTELTDEELAKVTGGDGKSTVTLAQNCCAGTHYTSATLYIR